MTSHSCSFPGTAILSELSIASGGIRRRQPGCRRSGPVAPVGRSPKKGRERQSLPPQGRSHGFNVTDRAARACIPCVAGASPGARSGIRVLRYAEKNGREPWPGSRPCGERRMGVHPPGKVTLGTQSSCVLCESAFVPSERLHECNQVLLLLARELQLQHQVEVLDGIVERQQPAVMQVRR
jgi:hypothetical protein